MRYVDIKLTYYNMQYYVLYIVFIEFIIIILKHFYERSRVVQHKTCFFLIINTFWNTKTSTKYLYIILLFLLK